jgi:hypothetical protein
MLARIALADCAETRFSYSTRRAQHIRALSQMSDWKDSSQIQPFSQAQQRLLSYSMAHRVKIKVRATGLT